MGKADGTNGGDSSLSKFPERIRDFLLACSVSNAEAFAGKTTIGRCDLELPLFIDGGTVKLIGCNVRQDEHRRFLSFPMIFDSGAMRGRQAISMAEVFVLRSDEDHLQQGLVELWENAVAGSGEHDRVKL